MWFTSQVSYPRLVLDALHFLRAVLLYQMLTVDLRVGPLFVSLRSA